MMIGIIVIALVIAGIGAGIVVAMSGGSKNAAHTAPLSLTTEGSSTTSTGGEEAAPYTGSSATTTQEESGATTPHSTTPSSGAASPLDTVNRYWADISAHHFSGAYGYLAPGAIRLTESQFVASEREAGIKSVQFHGEVTSSSGSEASVEVVSLVTHDVRFGCRTWMGSYEMTKAASGGAWRIMRANLSPQSCSG